MENNYIEKVVKGLTNKYSRLGDMVLCDERFHEAPGSSGHHHAFKGGLYKHTAEVMQFVRSMAEHGEMQELLSVAALFHDRNKIFEYRIEEDGSITKLPYRKLIGHVAGSWEFFMQCAREVRLDEKLQDKISHCLLAHHGRLEWRSPVEPQTPEAFILHSADMLSMLGAK